MKKPKSHYRKLNVILSFAILFSFSMVYFGFISENPILKSFKFNGAFFAFCLLFIAPWIGVYVSNKKYKKNIDLIIDYGKTSELVPMEMKSKILALEKIKQGEVITNEEFQTKALPICIDIWEIHNNQGNKELEEIKTSKKEQIIDAFNKGILTEGEMNAKINSL